MALYFYSPLTGTRLLAFFIIFFWTFTGQKLSAQSRPHKVWDKTIGGNLTDNFTSMGQTQDGGYILGGQSNSAISGDKTDSGRGSYDYWILKTDVNGNKLWDKTIGGSNTDNLEVVLQTTDGGYMLGGSSNSQQSGDKSQNTIRYGSYSPTYDYWIVRLDAQGNKLWDQNFGSYGEDRLQSLQQTTDGGFILGGYSDSGLGSKSDGSYGGNDYWVVKLDAQGNKLWDKTIGGNSQDYLYALQQTSDGGYILGGSSYSGASAFKSQASKGGSDYWVVKLDSNGNKVWDKSFGGGGNDNLFSVQQTTDGGYVLGGTSTSGKTGDKSQISRGGEDYWVVKLDASGTKMWDSAVGGSQYDNSRFVLQTKDGGYAIGGYSNSGASLPAGEKSLPTNGETDFWLIKLGATGTVLWDLDLGGNKGDYLYAGLQTPEGGFILGGSTGSDMSGDKSLHGRGSTDFWLVKLSSEEHSHIAPTIATTSDPTAFMEGSDSPSNPIAVEPALQLLSGDKTTLFSAIITLSANFNSAQDVLGFSNDGNTMGNITGSYDALSGRFHMVSEGASATVAQWQSAMRSITYLNTADKLFTSTRTISLTVNDGSSTSAIATKQITITPANDSPTDIRLTASTVTENVTANTTIASITSVDEDGSGNHTYQLVEGEGAQDNAFFAVSGVYLQIKHSPDFETKSSYQIRLRSTDNGGLFVEKAFVITVKDMDEIPPTGSLTINFGDAQVNFTNVSLRITYTDAYGVRLSNNGTDWTNWLQPASSMFWSLPGGDGIKTVYLQLKDAAGNISEVFSDEVILDQTPPTLTIGSPESDAATAYPIPISINFSEAVTGFTLSDMEVEGGTISNFTGQGQNYTVSLIPTVIGTIKVRVAAGQAQDAARNLNIESTAFTGTYAGTLPAVVSTTDAHSITTTTVVVGGNVLSEGGAVVTERGIVYSSYSNPTVSGPKVALSSGEGIFSTTLTDLVPGTNYYVRAYAINEKGVAYGQQIRFITAHIPVDLLSFTRYGKVLTNASSVQYKISFSKPVAGLTAANFSIVASGLSGTKVNSISFDNKTATATVTVYTGSGDGTIALGLDNTAGTTPAINGLPTELAEPFTIDKTPPLVTGVQDMREYSTERTITFTEGTATLDGEPFESGTIVRKQGYRSFNLTDAAGNVTHIFFNIDSEAPTVWGVSHGKAYNSPRTITFIDIAFSKATLNGAPFQDGDVVKEAGDYTLIAQDKLGNTTTVQFSLDLTYPIVSGVEQNGKYNTSRTISFNEGSAKIAIGFFTEYKPIEDGTTLTEDGYYTLLVTDKAGNTTRLNFSIDKTPPIVDGVADGYSYNTDRTLGFYEGTATLNGAPIERNSVVSSEGNYVLVVTDVHGNHTRINFTIDKIPPTGQFVINQSASYTNQESIELEITSSEATEMRLTNDNTYAHFWSRWEPVRAAKTWDLLTWGEGNKLSHGDGKKVVYLQLRDVAGNTITLTDTITLDRAAPTATISSFVTNITTADPFQVQIYFSEPVFGLTPEDVQVTGAGKGTFSGSGSHYTLELLPVLGNTITVSVSAEAAMDVAGNKNMAGTPWTMSSVVAGLDDLAKEVQIAVYPNPVPHSDLFILLKGMKHHKLQMILYDSRGRALLMKEVNAVSGEVREKISTSTLATGVYYLYLSDGFAASTRKIIVQ